MLAASLGDAFVGARPHTSGTTGTLVGQSWRAGFSQGEPQCHRACVHDPARVAAGSTNAQYPARWCGVSWAAVRCGVDIPHRYRDHEKRTNREAFVTLSVRSLLRYVAGVREDKGSKRSARSMHHGASPRASGGRRLVHFRRTTVEPRHCAQSAAAIVLTHCSVGLVGNFRSQLSLDRDCSSVSVRPQVRRDPSKRFR